MKNSVIVTAADDPILTFRGECCIISVLEFYVSFVNMYRCCFQLSFVIKMMILVALKRIILKKETYSRVYHDSPETTG